MARESLSKEADILTILRTHRFVLMALKHLLDPALRKELKTRSKCKQIDIQKMDRELKALARGEKIKLRDITGNLSVLSPIDNQLDAEEFKQPT